MARTPRMAQIEALLQDDPDDAFLRYGLAMEYLSAEEIETAVQHLRELIALKRDTPEPYIPAYLQAGQALVRLGEEEQAAEILREGIQKAKQVDDLHALSEMQGLLSTL